MSDMPNPPQTPVNLLDGETLQLHLASILASVPDGMVVTDESGKVLAFSRAAEALFGFTAEEMIGKPVNILMAGRDRTNHDNYIGNYLRTGERQIIGKGRVVIAARKDGTLFPIDLKIGEARIGEHFLFTAFIRDLTEQQRSELRMQEMQSELVHFSRLSAVGTMASALAHELNQPLSQPRPDRFAGPGDQGSAARSLGRSGPPGRASRRDRPQAALLCLARRG